jgi:Zn-dependent M28 family amino/carboxypeptidase
VQNRGSTDIVTIPLQAFCKAICCLVVLATAGAGRGAESSATTMAAPGLAAIRARDMREIVSVLSSDEFEGRAPATRGEGLTLDYIVAQFKKIGLEPGNPDGSYLQTVPLSGFRSVPTLSIGPNLLVAPDDYVAWSYRRQPKLTVTDSALVFVGYGVIAPDYGWDDYKGEDLKGKSLVMLINDPPIPDPTDPARLDETMFKGKAMTYYGRWTYKFEMAAKLGAAAALIIHETGPAGYPYSVVANSNGSEKFAIHAKAADPDLPPVAGWLAEPRARSLLKATGYDLDSLKRAALSRDFRPILLPQTLSATLSNSWRDVQSANVVGRITGSDPGLRDQVLVISAHWDHLGWDRTLPGSKSDQVFHGARDNASGIAALISLAKAFKAMKMPPKRTVLFLATTAEEQQLLGAKYYTQFPLYPLDRTVADINIDVVNSMGRTRDVEIIGSGNSTLEDLLGAAAAAQGRIAAPDSRSEKGYFYRADQLAFARAGVPVLYIKAGEQGIADPAGYSAKVEAYTAHQYHRPADRLTPDWDFEASVEDVGLLFQVAEQVASGRATPQWKDGSEFKAAYDKMKSAGGRSGEP